MPATREALVTAKQDWLLLALAHRAGRPLTPAQIQKAMFLMGAEARTLVEPRSYDFTPYNYGPFDASVYHDLDAMVEKGFRGYAVLLCGAVS